jgi:hypothetical protein
LPHSGEPYLNTRSPDRYRAAVGTAPALADTTARADRVLDRLTVRLGLPADADGWLCCSDLDPTSSVAGSATSPSGTGPCTGATTR